VLHLLEGPKGAHVTCKVVACAVNGIQSSRNLLLACLVALALPVAQVVRLVALNAYIHRGEVEVYQRVAVVTADITLGLGLKIRVGKSLPDGVDDVVLVVLALGAREDVREVLPSLVVNVFAAGRQSC
jgi:hypothetical protein